MEEIVEARKKIGLVAHDNKKDDLIEGRGSTARSSDATSWSRRGPPGPCLRRRSGSASRSSRAGHWVATCSSGPDRRRRG